MAARTRRPTPPPKWVLVAFGSIVLAALLAFSWIVDGCERLRTDYDAEQADAAAHAPDMSKFKSHKPIK